MSNFYLNEAEETFRRQVAYWHDRGCSEISIRFLILYVLLPISALLAQEHIFSASYATTYGLLLFAQALMTFKFWSIKQAKHANVRAEQKALLFANFSIAWLLVLTLLFLKLSMDVLTIAPGFEHQESTRLEYLAIFTAITLMGVYWAPRSYPEFNLGTKKKQGRLIGYGKFLQILAIGCGIFTLVRVAARIETIHIGLSFLIFLGSCFLILITIIAGHRTILVLRTRKLKGTH